MLAHLLRLANEGVLHSTMAWLSNERLPFQVHLAAWGRIALARVAS